MRFSSRSAWPASAAARSGPTRWACGNDWVWPAPCCVSRPFSFSTSRRTGSTRRASPSFGPCSSNCIAAARLCFCPVHLLAEVEQIATRVGVLARGRLVLQDELARLTAPTGATVVLTPDPERVRATLDGRVISVDGDRVVVTGGNPAEVNALLVAAGISVTGLAVDRPTLEQVVLAAAGTSADRVDR